MEATRMAKAKIVALKVCCSGAPAERAWARCQVSSEVARPICGVCNSLGVRGDNSGRIENAQLPGPRFVQVD
eukprot:scaffold66893_cov62-Phaeocystis_antarctica.AAC.2